MKARGAKAGIVATALAVMAGAGCGKGGDNAGEAAGQARPAEAEAVAKAAPGDIHSYARPEQVRVTHVDMDLNVDFPARVLKGTAVLHLKRDDPKAPLRLDSRSLDLKAVRVGREGGQLAGATWMVRDPDPILGSEVVVQLTPDADRVAIEYVTSPEASGLQWLEPSQTAGGKHPYMYSQSQAIHARSWIPCQDSPAVRVTYDAKVQVAPPLKAVMGARKGAATGPGTFSFTMPHAIPSYLIAIGVGDVALGEVGARTGVWTEPSMLKRSVAEFADMEKMLHAIEPVYGPYRWERYDTLVLPPSFPFGGMENPMLTFLTPTILAGDKSLVALVAHEMAHSWSGNLVTNATWSDFWLNEGFTVYIERRIMEEVYGDRRVQMEWSLGLQDLEKGLEELAGKPEDQQLYIDLAGRDPDDAVTDVAYEKGAHLLRRLELTYGREAFDPFLRSWFDEHAFTSVTTDQFLAFLQDRLIGRHAPRAGATPPDLALWVRGPGLPKDVPRIPEGIFADVDQAAKSWAEKKAPASQLATKDWTTQHWLHFLRALPPTVESARMKELDEAFAFTRTGNAEILDEWLVLAIRHGYPGADARLEEFLTSQGRRKFLKPLYEELVKTEAGRGRARQIYAKGRPLYHSISRATLDKIVLPQG
ncbi:MAG: M1 family metallopeptidase [Candidatus Polarisedimenticolia bacterium]